MSSPTILEQNNRIRAIMATFPGIGTDLSEGAVLVALPAFVVAPNGATRQPHSPTRRRVTRQFEIIGVVSEMTKITSLANRLAVYADAEAVLEAWVSWLTKHPKLMLNDGGLVVSVGDISDGGFGPWTYQEKDYSAFRLQVPVTTLQP